MSASLLSNLLTNAKRALYAGIDPLPVKGAKLDEFTVVSSINQAYGIYGFTPAIAAISAQGHLILAFKGTDDLSDVIKDIESSTNEIWPTLDPTGNAQFADGFLDITIDILIPWFKTFQSTIQNAKSCTICGHSLGAALSYFAALWLTSQRILRVKPVIYTYATPVFGNMAAKQLFEKYKLEAYDVTAQNDPVPAISLPWLERIGNGGPQRNFILNGTVEEPTFVISSSSNVPWYFNPAYAGRHRLVYTYIPMMQNILAALNGGVKCTYSASALRNDPLRACAGLSTKCVKDGKLIPCGAEGWCGSNNVCVTKHQPYNCSAATDCNVGAMCVTPGYHLPTSSWDSITEPCRQGATCSRNPWNLTKYCWNN